MVRSLAHGSGTPTALLRKARSSPITLTRATGAPSRRAARRVSRSNASSAWTLERAGRGHLGHGGRADGGRAPFPGARRTRSTHGICRGNRGRQGTPGVRGQVSRNALSSPCPLPGCYSAPAATRRKVLRPLHGGRHLHRRGGPAAAGAAAGRAQPAQRAGRPDQAARAPGRPGHPRRGHPARPGVHHPARPRGHPPPRLAPRRRHRPHRRHGPAAPDLPCRRRAPTAPCSSPR